MRGIAALLLASGFLGLSLNSGAQNAGTVVKLAGNGPIFPWGENRSFSACDLKGAYSGDGGTAASAGLYAPQDVAVDSLGNVYIADSGNHRVRKVDTNGVITTIAGNGRWGGSGDGGPATSASLGTPINLALDGADQLFILDSDSSTVRRVDRAGVITTVAGSGQRGFSGDGGPAIKAAFDYPAAITVDVKGNLYIADRWNNRIRKVTSEGIITTVAGAGSFGAGTGGSGKRYNGDNIPATEAQLDSPTDVATDPSGNLYIADSYNSRVRKVDGSGVITTVAGGGIGLTEDVNPEGMVATDFPLYDPWGLSVDSTGTLLFLGGRAGDLMSLDPQGILHVVVGRRSSEQQVPSEFQPLKIDAITLDREGNILLTDSFSNRIMKIIKGASPAFALEQSFTYAGLNDSVQVHSIKAGDLNGDDRVTLADVIRAAQIAVNLIPATPSDLALGDVAPGGSQDHMGDGQLDLKDVIQILKAAIGVAGLGESRQGYTIEPYPGVHLSTWAYPAHYQAGDSVQAILYREIENNSSDPVKWVIVPNYLLNPIPFPLGKSDPVAYNDYGPGVGEDWGPVSECELEPGEKLGAASNWYPVQSAKSNLPMGIYVVQMKLNDTGPDPAASDLVFSVVRDDQMLSTFMFPNVPFAFRVEP